MNRRPIAARDLGLTRSIAAWLAPRVPANAISIASLVCGLGAGAALAATSLANERGLWLAGAVLAQLRLLCNLLDGMVAERAKQTSNHGELYNDVPDRVSDAAALIGLGYAVGGNAALGWFAALAAVTIAYLRALGFALTRRQHYVGPFAKPQRMAVVTVAALVGFAAPGWVGEPLLFDLALPGLALAIVAAGCALTAWRRLRLIARALDEARP
jgi:phosphatidylglycerophosphate synthase